MSKAAKRFKYTPVSCILQRIQAHTLTDTDAHKNKFARKFGISACVFSFFFFIHVKAERGEPIVHILHHDEKRTEQPEVK